MIDDDLSSISWDALTQAMGWQAQYRLITNWGKCVQVKTDLRCADHLIKGCEVSAWLACRVENDTYIFAFDSDSRVINGLAALLLSSINHKTHEQIRAIDLVRLLSDAGLEKHLTPSRNNGLKAIVERVTWLINNAQPL